MMTGPGDEVAAATGRPGYLRASHAERERVIDTVKAAFVQGQLTIGELDARVGQALAARTHAELAAVTAGIPRGVGPSQAAEARPSAAAAAREQAGQPGRLGDHSHHAGGRGWAAWRPALRRQCSWPCSC